MVFMVVDTLCIFSYICKEWHQLMYDVEHVRKGMKMDIDQDLNPRENTHSAQSLESSANLQKRWKAICPPLSPQLWKGLCDLQEGCIVYPQ